MDFNPPVSWQFTFHLRHAAIIFTKGREDKVSEHIFGAWRFNLFTHLPESNNLSSFRLSLDIFCLKKSKLKYDFDVEAVVSETMMSQGGRC